MLLKQIFVQDGQPIRMHIDSSIANVNVRAALATRIMVSFCSSPLCVCLWSRLCGGLEAEGGQGRGKGEGVPWGSSMELG